MARLLDRDHIVHIIFEHIDEGAATLFGDPFQSHATVGNVPDRVVIGTGVGVRFALFQFLTVAFQRTTADTGAGELDAVAVRQCKTGHETTCGNGETVSDRKDLDALFHLLFSFLRSSQVLPGDVLLCRFSVDAGGSTKHETGQHEQQKNAS